MWFRTRILTIVVLEKNTGQCGFGKQYWPMWFWTRIQSNVVSDLGLSPVFTTLINSWCVQFIRSNYSESPEDYSEPLKRLEQLRQASLRILNPVKTLGHCSSFPCQIGSDTFSSYLNVTCVDMQAEQGGFKSLVYIGIASGPSRVFSTAHPYST